MLFKRSDSPLSLWRTGCFWRCVRSQHCSLQVFQQLLAYAVIQLGSWGGPAAGLQDSLSTVLSYSALPCDLWRSWLPWTWSFISSSHGDHCLASLFVPQLENFLQASCTFSVFSCLRWQDKSCPRYSILIESRNENVYFLKRLHDFHLMYS